MVTIARRQQDGPVAAPTASGLSGDAITAGGDSAPGASLVLDTNVPQETTPVADIPFVPTLSSLPTSSSPLSTPSLSAASGSSERFSTGVVVGVCVGAFAGAFAIIVIGVIIYRRSAPRKGRRAQPRHLTGGSLNFRDTDKLRTHKDDDHHDHWEGKYPPPPPTAQVSPMEKFNMFKKSPSLKSGFTHRSQDPYQDPESDHPRFAPTLSTVSQGHSVADAQVDPTANGTVPYIGRVDAGPTLSWDMSFVSHSDGGRMSPLVNKAIPTPQATTNYLHHAQSAEVLHFEGQTAEIVNPFEDSQSAPSNLARKKSNSGSPFFGSRAERESISVRRTRSRAASNASSHAETVTSKRAHKRSLSRAASAQHEDNLDDMYQSDDEHYDRTSRSGHGNPFADPDQPSSMPPAPLPTLPVSGSVSHPYAAPIFRATPASPTTPTYPEPMVPPPATPTNDPVAIKGLLDALDIGLNPERDSRNTFTSVGSAYSQDVSAEQFPAPPGSSSS